MHRQRCWFTRAGQLLAKRAGLLLACHRVGARPSDQFRAAWQAPRARVVLRPTLAGVAAAGGALAR
eukprot:15458644-Alexandrium_andersonii.AAC.1